MEKVRATKTLQPVDGLAHKERTDDSEVLVRVENLSKKFCRNLKRSLWYGVQDMAGEVVGRTKKDTLRKDEFWAVKDVNFELRRGECLGLIGHNGAGKSTLLKMLNGLIKPDQGRIEMNGRVGALIELGAGFNPVLTGRENIYINGQILGITKKEIDEKYEAIVDFAEIPDFMESPVQSYSSGMKVRLGFAIAAQMEPDILIIDEVLAVGDVGFQVKCFNVIQTLSRKSAVILVSHSMPNIARTASLGLLLEKGKIDYLGKNISDLVNLYFEKFDSERESFSGKLVHVKNLIVKDQDSGSLENVKCFSDISISYTICSNEFQKGNYTCVYVFFDQTLRQLASYQSSKFLVDSDIEYNLHIKVMIEKFNLSQGKYNLAIAFYKIGDNNKASIYSYLKNIKEITVYSDTNFTHSNIFLYGSQSISSELYQ